MAALGWLVALQDPELARAVTSLRELLSRSGWQDAGDLDAPGWSWAGHGADALMVWADRPLPDGLADALTECGLPLVLAGPTLAEPHAHPQLVEASGLSFGPPTQPHDIRVRAGAQGTSVACRLLDHAHAGLAHLGRHTHVRGPVLRVEKADDDVEVLLTASVGLVEHPVASWRPSTRALAWTLGADPAGVTARGPLRLLVLALRYALGQALPGPVRVGLLGYGAIGHEHNRAVQSIAGLELAAVCDTSAERLAAARGYAPDVRTYTDAGELVADPEVDLLLVSTPPSTHAGWAMAGLRAGKHVIVEKPFATRTEQADAVLQLAAESGLVAGVYQNRRFDPDHLAVRSAVRAGRLGELFHLEAFVGGYGHPCNLWHSDVEVSGGAFYDWGAHVLDQLLDLVPDEIAHVTATEHKRQWFDVTNADHSRVTIQFATGVEATFIYSDLAAALKPRWYVLGTRGAIVGHWRVERVIGRSDIGTMVEDVLAPTDSPPLLDLHAADGSVTRMATPLPPPHAFHAELADQIQLGLPPTVTGAQSRRVLSVMEAATLSARTGGRPVQPRPVPSSGPVSSGPVPGDSAQGGSMQASSAGSR